MSEADKLPGEGEVKIIRKERVRLGCDYCGEPAFYRNTYLDEGDRGARRNPRSAAYGRDDCTWCSDHDDFCCPDCHQKREHSNVPDGFKWCSTFQADRFPHMFLGWRETDITPKAETEAA